MSTTAIDTARTTERLSAFLSEIGADEPIDNYFDRYPVIEAFMRNKKTMNGGRQVMFPIDSGENSTIKDFSDYDEFDTSSQDTALTVVYPMVNKGGSIVISWEEQREVAGDDHRVFDLIKHRRSNAMRTLLKKLEVDAFAATQSTEKISSLNVVIDSTGETGGLNASTDADWAAFEVASGSFASQGLTDMNSLYNQIVEGNGSPDTVVTSRAVYEYYETLIDPDVRYATAQGVGGRGFKSLEFKGIPIIYTINATAGTLYMWDSENVYMTVDSEGDMKIDDFEKAPRQKAFWAPICFRGNIVCTRRQSSGKMTGITA